MLSRRKIYTSRSRSSGGGTVTGNGPRPQPTRDQKCGVGGSRQMAEGG